MNQKFIHAFVLWETIVFTTRKVVNLLHLCKACADHEERRTSADVASPRHTSGKTLLPTQMTMTMLRETMFNSTEWKQLLQGAPQPVLPSTHCTRGSWHNKAPLSAHCTLCHQLVSIFHIICKQKCGTPAWMLCTKRTKWEDQPGGGIPEIFQVLHFWHKKTSNEATSCLARQHIDAIDFIPGPLRGLGGWLCVCLLVNGNCWPEKHTQSSSGYKFSKNCHARFENGKFNFQHVVPVVWVRRRSRLSSIFIRVFLTS